MLSTALESNTEREEEEEKEEGREGVQTSEETDDSIQSECHATTNQIPRLNIRYVAIKLIVFNFH